MGNLQSAASSVGGDAMIYVVFDSSVLIADYNLQTVPMKALLAESKKGTISVAIPEVVFAEVTNKRREDYTAFLESVKSHQKRLGMGLRETMPDPLGLARLMGWSRAIANAMLRLAGLDDVSLELEWSRLIVVYSDSAAT